MSRKKIQEKLQSSSYEAKDIYVLEGLEPVRKRPGMYIGSTGPEGLHHLIWECVDNSVTYNTPIVIRGSGKIQIKRIGEMIDRLFENNPQHIKQSHRGEAEVLRQNLKLEALSFDPRDLKLKFQPISSLIRHKVNSEIYKITLQNGREVEITPYHSLFTLQQGQVLPIKGSDLKIGTPVIVPKIWPEVEKPIKEIDLIDEFLQLPAQKTENLSLYKVRSLLTNEIYRKLKPLLQKKAERTLTQHSSNLFYDYRRWDYLPFNFLRQLGPEDIKKIKNQVLIGTRGNERIRLNPKLEISRALVELLGIFAAEGTIIKNKGLLNRAVLSLGAHEKTLIQYTCSLVKKTFGLEVKPRYVHETARTIAIDSYLVALILRDILKAGENSASKEVPSLVFNLTREFRERYLIAYLAGDGYPTEVFTNHLVGNTVPGGTERRKFSSVAKNGGLIFSLTYLIASLGKSYSYGKRRRGQKKRFVGVNYKGEKKIREIKSQEFFHSIDFYWHDNASYINYLPTKEIVSNVSWQRPYSFGINLTGGVSRSKVSSLLEEKRIILYPLSQQFLDSDLGVLRVKKIQKIPYQHPWVYDLSVPGGENFVGGFSPIVIHNSLDEAMAGFAKNIEVVLLPGNKVKTMDDGRGIPVEKHPQTKKSALETVMTTLHAGGKFGGEAYKVSGGLHGVGVSVVCALSSYMRVEVCRAGAKYFQEYAKGKTKAKVKKIGPCKGTGTSVLFEPDQEIFSAKGGSAEGGKEIKFDLEKILTHLRQQAYLTRGVRITVTDNREKTPQTYTFYFEGGLQSYVKYLVQGVVVVQQNVFYTTGEKEGIMVEAAFQYTRDRECYEESFANNINTGEGGTHLTGFRSALTRSLNDYARKNGFLKEKDENLTGEDVRDGFTGVVSIKLREPQFEGQTKAKLGNPEAKTAVETVVADGLSDFLERNPQDARAIIEKCLLTAKARKAAKAARQTVLRKGILEGLALPGKLADCASRTPEESELFIVEGDSAGGCFSEDTKVALTDGRSLSFKQLVREHREGKKNYCYTTEKDGAIGIELIENPRRTKTNTEVIKVVLDNGEEIICTPNHNFMLRNGSYREAKDLKLGQSLMSMPEVLILINKKPAFEADSLETADSSNALELSSVSIITNQESLSSPQIRKPWTARELHPSASGRQLQSWDYPPPTADTLYHSSNGNHKVVKTKVLRKREDVYDLEVNGTHNFALASGVFVHNSAKQGRARQFQAILPLRGKILNIERARLDKILDSKEIKALIIALGTAIAEDFDIEKLRYQRIVIMTDADTDGSHIRTLLLTLFYRHFQPIIDKGYLYIAQPPLYRIQAGKRIEYAYNEADKTEILGSIKKEIKIPPSIQRYKGLGEMNPEQLWETTMNPENRVLLKVNIENAREADRIFDTLMGDEVLPRKKFIQTHAKKVKNLDI